MPWTSLMDSRLFWASEESGASSAGAPSLPKSDYPGSAYGGFGSASWNTGPLDTAPGETPPSMEGNTFLSYGHALEPGSVASQAMYAAVPPSHSDERAWMPPGSVPRRPTVLTPNAFAAGQRGWDRAPVAQPQMPFDGGRPDLYAMHSHTPHAVQVPPAARAQHHDRTNEEITTLFIAGFPEDITEREFGNMFLFARGYEASMLKLPQATASARGEDVSDASTSSRVRQIIGFVKFRTRTDAVDARDLLNGFRIDPERGSILKAELAKKNLHMKRQASLVVRPPEPYVQTPTSATAMRSPWSAEPSAGGAAAYGASGADDLGDRRSAAYARLGTTPGVSPSDSWSPHIGAQRMPSDTPATAGVLPGDADATSAEGARTVGDATSQLGGLSLSGEAPARTSNSPLPDWLRSALDTDEDPKARVRGPSRSLPEPRLNPDQVQLPKQKSAPVAPVRPSPEPSRLGESASGASSAPVFSMSTSPGEDAGGPLQSRMEPAIRSPGPLEQLANPMEQSPGGANRLSVPGTLHPHMPAVQSPGALSRSPNSVSDAFAAATPEPASASPVNEDIEEASKLEQEYVFIPDPAD